MTSRREDSPRDRARRLKIHIVAVGIALILAMWVVVTVSVVAERQKAIAQARADADNLSAAFQDEVAHTFGDIARAMEVVAQRMRSRGAAFDIYAWAHDLPMLAPAIQAAIIGPDGRLLSSTLEPHAKPVDLSDREHFRVHLDGSHPGIFVSKPLIGRLSGRMSIQISERVAAADGRLLGVIVFSLTPGQLTTLHRSVDLGAEGVIVLARLDGTVVARFTKADESGAAAVGASIAGGPRPALIGENGHGSYLRRSVVDGITRLYSYRRVASYPLVVTVGLSLDPLLAAARAQAVLVISLAAAATLLLAGLAAYLVREIRHRAAREIELAEERGKLRRSNRELVESKERAEEASRAKSQFLANMSHELRTPLNAIIGFSQIIEGERMGPVGTPRYREYAGDIRVAGEHLLELINNILDISRIEAGKLAVVESLVELPQIVEASLLAVRAQAQRNSLALEVALPAECAPFRADALKLRQILINLLSNAVKFTPAGGRITLTAERGPDGLSLAVADTGIGMSPEEVAIARQPFSQVENAFTKRYQGSGLGLPLAERLVALHGGRLEIASGKGVGTTVRIWLPAPLPREAAE
jgi:signal transduction histidine kinase